MNCNTCKEYIMKYFDGEKAIAQDEQFKKHLDACQECRDEFNCMETIFSSIEEQTAAEPPENFEAMVMEKVNLYEKQRSKRNSTLIVLAYNAATLLSIVLLLVYVADIKNFDFSAAFDQIRNYMSSFSSATEAVFGVVGDISRLLGNAILTVVKAAFTVVRSYYYVFLALITMLFAIEKLFAYVCKLCREETK
jgi:predicted anti-sigma-YlaC factor YlaD